MLAVQPPIWQVTHGASVYWPKDGYWSFGSDHLGQLLELNAVVDIKTFGMLKAL